MKRHFFSMYSAVWTDVGSGLAKSLRLCSIGVILGFTLLSGIFPPLLAAEAENTGATLEVSIDKESLIPRALEVKSGTTVVWINRSPAPLRVRFMSKAVSTTCKDARNFQVGPKGIYVSKLVAPGDVASLCFLEPENYEYEVEFVPESSLSTEVSAEDDADTSPTPTADGKAAPNKRSGVVSVRG